MHSVARQLQSIATAYVAGLVESVGLVCIAPHREGPATSSEETATQRAPATADCGPSPHWAVRRVALWNWIARDPVLWERLGRFTQWSLGVSLILLLSGPLVPLTCLHTMAAVALGYVLLPVLGVLWNTKVFNEARSLRLGQYHVNTRTSSPTSPSATSPLSPVRLLWLMLAHNIPAPRTPWVRGNTALPLFTSPPIAAPETHTADEALRALATRTRPVPTQSSYQQLDKTVSLLLLTAFIALLESCAPIHWAGVGCGMFLNALLYAFYVFDFRYVQDGASLEQQVTDFDAHTAYYCGFGTLSVILVYGVFWLTGNAGVGASLYFGLYGWHVTFSDYAHRHLHCCSPHGADIDAQPFAFCAPDAVSTPSPRVVVRESTPESVVNNRYAPRIFTRWLRAARWFSVCVGFFVAHVQVFWRCALIVVLTTAIIAIC